MMKGLGASEGYGIDRVMLIGEQNLSYTPREIADVDAELERFESARVKVQAQQHALYEKALKEAGEDSAGIFEAHEMMLDDDDLIDACKAIMENQKHTAEYAVRQGFDNVAQMFRDMDDPYFQARSADVIDLNYLFHRSYFFHRNKCEEL